MSITAWEIAGLTREEWVRHSLDIRIRLAAGPYLDSWDYSLRKARVLYDLPGAMRADRVEWSAGDERVTNCSTLTASLLTSCFPAAPWTLDEYGDLQVFADRLPSRPSAPIEAVTRMGIGYPVGVLQAGAWHLVQGWRTFDPDTPHYSGHAFLVLADREGDGILVLEATSRRSIGPRYRRSTLEELRREYSHTLHLAELTGP
tara:strand:+ start:1239 stop:1844 length:606 start_codon:yes stop_codon:yes gene_type:complete